MAWPEAETPPLGAAELVPAEEMALIVALAQVLRGEVPRPNTATVCVLALARITGRYRWTAEDDR